MYWHAHIIYVQSAIRNGNIPKELHILCMSYIIQCNERAGIISKRSWQIHAIYNDTARRTIWFITQ